ncbi:MAG: hypothetical protein E7378_03685 [Clostridiales bacterium]|nr:hypothetical protein [Clostridiales bacterium]
MNKLRLTINIILAVLLVFLGTLGTVQLVKDWKYKNNDVSFIVNDQDAYFSAVGNYYYGQEAINSKTPSIEEYKVEYTQEHYYAKEEFQVGNWAIGDTKFVLDEIDIFMIELNITNLNLEYAMVAKAKDIAYQNNTTAGEIDPFFITKVDYKNGSSAQKTVFCNDPENKVNLHYYNASAALKTVSINEEVIAPGETLTMIFTYKLNTRTDKFEFAANNIKIELTVNN